MSCSEESSLSVSSWRDVEVRRRDVLALGPNEIPCCTLIREMLSFFGETSSSAESSSLEESLEVEDLDRETDSLTCVVVETMVGEPDLG